MPNHVLLSSVEHKDLKVIKDRGAAYGDNQWFALTFPKEFRTVQGYYPIFFHKDQHTGQFFPVALFGFQHQENLFLQHNNWQDLYIPLSVRRQPFLIGQQKVTEDGVEQIHRVLHIDLEHPRVSQTEGEALFLPYGGNSAYLDEMASLMETLHLGMDDARRFVEQLLAQQLLEPFTMEVKLDDGQPRQLVGFYTSHEEKLAALTAEQLAALQQQGYLQAIYMALASQTQVMKLLKLKNQQQKQNEQAA